MGSPLSPIVANLYMETFEKAAITALAAPRLWTRYVDDMFVIWPNGQDKLEGFHQHLNSQYPQIKFTMEREEDNKISFLDVAVTRKNGNFTTKVFRKPTRTDLYTHYTSHHHPSEKAGTIRCLGLRAEKICDGESKEKELKHLRDTFTRNGCSKEIIEQNLRKTTPTIREVEGVSNTDKARLLYLPYLKGLSEKIQRACRKIGVQAVFKSSGTFRDVLTKVKSPAPRMSKTLFTKSHAVTAAQST